MSINLTNHLDADGNETGSHEPKRKSRKRKITMYQNKSYKDMEKEDIMALIKAVEDNESVWMYANGLRASDFTEEWNEIEKQVPGLYRHNGYHAKRAWQTLFADYTVQREALEAATSRKESCVITFPYFFEMQSFLDVTEKITYIYTNAGDSDDPLKAEPDEEEESSTSSKPGPSRKKQKRSPSPTDENLNAVSKECQAQSKKAETALETPGGPNADIFAKVQQTLDKLKPVQQLQLKFAISEACDKFVASVAEASAVKE